MSKKQIITATIGVTLMILGIAELSKNPGMVMLSSGIGLLVIASYMEFKAEEQIKDLERKLRRQKALNEDERKSDLSKINSLNKEIESLKKPQPKK